MECEIVQLKLELRKILYKEIARERQLLAHNRDDKTKRGHHLSIVAKCK